MHRLVLTTLVAGLLLACRSMPREDVDSQAHAFIRAVATNDTASLRRLAADSQPIMVAVTARGREPRLLQFASQEMEFAGGDVSGDTAKYFYVIRPDNGTERLALGLVYRGGTWLVYHVGFPDRQ